MIKYRKGKANKPSHKVFYWEIDFASITLFQSCKLQTKAYSWIDETPNQDLRNHVNCRFKHMLRLSELEKHTHCCLKHSPWPARCYHRTARARFL